MTTRRRKIPRIRLAGDPTLTTVCYPVDGNDGTGQIVWQMRKVVERNDHCVGLSANQIGYNKRIIAFRDIKSQCISVIINPIIKNVSTDEDSFVEGCLSYPGKSKEILRPVSIILDYQTIQGNMIYDFKIEGFLARVIQHEIDHLNGKCLVGEMA